MPDRDLLLARVGNSIRHFRERVDHFLIDALKDPLFKRDGGQRGGEAFSYRSEACLSVDRCAVVVLFGDDFVVLDDDEAVEFGHRGGIIVKLCNKLRIESLLFWRGDVPTVCGLWRVVDLCQFVRAWPQHLDNLRSGLLDVFVIELQAEWRKRPGHAVVDGFDFFKKALRRSRRACSRSYHAGVGRRRDRARPGRYRFCIEMLRRAGAYRR